MSQQHGAGDGSGARVVAGRAVRASAASLLLACLASCVGLDEPSALDQQAAFAQDVAAAQQAQANEALGRRDAARAQEEAVRDASERQEAARFAAGVGDQQAARARLRPILRDCLSTNARRWGGASNEPVDRVVETVLQTCRPVVTALARTVELARMSSDGLTDELAARLRPEVRRMVLANRQNPP